MAAKNIQDFITLFGALLNIYAAAAATAKSLQLCPTLCDPIDGSPPGSPVPGILQARTVEWVAISFSNAWKWSMKVKSLSSVWPSRTDKKGELLWDRIGKQEKKYLSSTDNHLDCIIGMAEEPCQLAASILALSF